MRITDGNQSTLYDRNSTDYGLFFIILIIHKSAYADPVLITDDASVADLYTCHFESNINFYKHQEVNSSFSPVCGIAKNLELSFQLDDHLQNKNRP